MTRFKIGVASVAAVASLAFAGSASAAEFQNGSFEEPVRPGLVTLGAGDTSITGWVVTGNGIDSLGGYFPAPDGTNALDLNATDAGGIQTTFDTERGTLYTVRFLLAHNNGCGAESSTVRVSAAGKSSDYSSNNANDDYDDEIFTFPATGTTTTLSFSSQSSGCGGPLLDFVRLSAQPRINTISGSGINNPNSGKPNTFSITTDYQGGGIYGGTLTYRGSSRTFNGTVECMNFDEDDVTIVARDTTTGFLNRTMARDGGDSGDKIINTMVNLATASAKTKAAYSQCIAPDKAKLSAANPLAGNPITILGYVP